MGKYEGKFFFPVLAEKRVKPLLEIHVRIPILKMSDQVAANNYEALSMCQALY